MLNKRKYFMFFLHFKSDFLLIESFLSLKRNKQEIFINHGAFPKYKLSGGKKQNALLGKRYKWQPYSKDIMESLSPNKHMK